MGSRDQSTERGPFPAILGLDFWDRTKMLVNVASRKFSFGFVPSCSGTFSLYNLNVGDEPHLQNLCEEALDMAIVSEVWRSGVNSSYIITNFPAFFTQSRDG